MYKRNKSKRKLDYKDTPKEKVHKPMYLEETQLAAGMTKQEQEEVWQYFCKQCKK